MPIPVEVTNMSRKINRRALDRGTYTAVFMQNGRLMDAEIYDVRGELPDNLVGLYDRVSPTNLLADLEELLKPEPPRAVMHWTWNCPTPVQIPTWPR